MLLNRLKRADGEARGMVPTQSYRSPGDDEAPGLDDPVVRNSTKAVPASY